MWVTSLAGALTSNGLKLTLALDRAQDIFLYQAQASLASLLAHSLLQVWEIFPRAGYLHLSPFQ